MTETFFREAGAGPGVLCVHCNASSSAQWRGLMDRLAARFHVLAADGHGAGRGPAWPSDRMLCLQDEVALLRPLIEQAGEPLTLVGHSYGGAVALLAALQTRPRALVLYEPTLFALLDEEAPPPNEAEGIRRTVADAAAHLARGDRGAAAGRFIDYWMGDGSWSRTADNRRTPIEEAIVRVQGWGTALFTQPTPLSDFGTLDVPVLLMVGSESPASSRGVARLLAGVLPRLQLLQFEGLGHMGPITHPEVVNAAIEEFLMRKSDVMTHALDNPVWHALSGPHRGFAAGHGLALHYPREVAVFSAIAEASEQAFADLARGLPPGTEARLVRAHAEPLPAGWSVVNDVPLLQMEARSFDGQQREGPAIVTLGPQDRAAVMALVELTQPGPFGPRTLEMGHYIGVFEHGRLLAMAGERLRLEAYVELSAICTHPSARGRRLAEGLMRRLMHDALQRGLGPFLHVLPANTGAIALYQRLGFVTRAEMHYRWCKPLETARAGEFSHGLD